MGKKKRDTIRFSTVLGWLALGWRDLQASLGISIGYAGFFMLVGMLLAWLLSSRGYGLLFFLLAGGFLIVAPLIVAAYYAVAQRLEQGEKPAFAHISEGYRNSHRSLWVIGFLSAAMYLIWVTDGLIVYSVYFDFAAPPELAAISDPDARADLVAFIFFSSVLGGVLAAIVFCITLFSVPHAFIAKADFVDAIVFSVKAVGRFSPALLLWALVIGGSMMLVLLFAIPLGAVLLPVLALANYHAYRDVAGRVVLLGSDNG